MTIHGEKGKMNNAGTTKLRDIAGVIRSKNAGPNQITFDIIFNHEEEFEKACESGSFTGENVAKTYGIDEGKILGIYFYSPANSIKITILREVSSGSMMDTDVYGAQQHAPLLDMEINYE